VVDRADPGPLRWRDYLELLIFDLLCAQHTANMFVALILGLLGDPSSTSVSGACVFICWSSPPVEGQVVRLRPSSGSQQLDLFVGAELASILLLELGGDAWSSPATGGRGTGLDRVFCNVCRVLCVSVRSSLQILGLLVQEMLEDLTAICTCHVWIYEKAPLGSFDPALYVQKKKR
jgi:hypothetical protein